MLFLTQSDTTVGFLSQNQQDIIEAKKRPPNKPFLITVASLRVLKRFTRVPNKYKKRVRRAKKITFIYPNNQAIRVVKRSLHLDFLNKIEWGFSSSANISSQLFDEKFARQSADIVVEDRRGLFEGDSSKIYRINRVKIKRIR